MVGDRILRAGIRQSDRTAALIRGPGGWMAQVFFDWLLTVVDDYGRYDARPAILRGHVFPLLVDDVSGDDIRRCLDACAAPGVELIQVYEVDGKPYLSVREFRRTRTTNENRSGKNVSRTGGRRSWNRRPSKFSPVWTAGRRRVAGTTKTGNSSPDRCRGCTIRNGRSSRSRSCRSATTGSSGPRRRT
jgi:hypothetical protein